MSIVPTSYGVSLDPNMRIASSGRLPLKSLDVAAFADACDEVVELADEVVGAVVATAAATIAAIVKCLQNESQVLPRKKFLHSKADTRIFGGFRARKICVFEW